jgi:hypothetical protein
VYAAMAPRVLTRVCPFARRAMEQALDRFGFAKEGIVEEEDEEAARREVRRENHRLNKWNKMRGAGSAQLQPSKQKQMSSRKQKKLTR